MIRYTEVSNTFCFLDVSLQSREIVCHVGPVISDV